MVVNIICPVCGKQRLVRARREKLVGLTVTCSCGERFTALLRPPAPRGPLWEILKRHPILLISFWVMIGTILGYAALGYLAPEQATIRRIVGSIVLCGMILFIFIRFVFIESVR